MNLKNIFSIALLCTASVVSAQTNKYNKTFNVERVYKHFTTANGATEARQGVFANDKFYIHNWMNSQVEVWSQDGELLETFESKGTGPAITADDAGNIVIENTDNPWPEASGSTRYYRIFKGGQNNPLDISITYDALREPSSGIRSDYFGPIEGDVMSAEGGVIVSMMQHRPVVNIARIALGEPAENRSFWVDTAYAGGNIVCNIGYSEAAISANWREHVGNGYAYSQVNCFKYGDEYLVSKSMVGLKGFVIDENSLGSNPLEEKAYRGVLVNDHSTVYDPTATEGDPTEATYMSGDRLFTMGGRLYVIKHITYKNEMAGLNSFAIVDDLTGKVLAVWHGFYNGDTDRAGTACASWLKVVPTSDTTGVIYQYFPADGRNKAFISKYTFTIE